MDYVTEHMTDCQLGKHIEEILIHGLQVEDVRTTVDEVCQFVLHSSFSNSLLHSLSNVCNDQSQASPMFTSLLSSFSLSPKLTFQRTEIVRLVSDMMVRWAVRCEDRTRGMGQARAVKHLLYEVMGRMGLCIHLYCTVTTLVLVTPATALTNFLTFLLLFQSHSIGSYLIWCRNGTLPNYRGKKNKV